MKDLIISELMYLGSDWLDLLMGGLVVTSVVIFLMGILKKVCVNRIKSKLGRKIVLAWLSILIVLPVTAGSMLYNEFSIEHFWGIYTANCVLTIAVYWFYENTALRDGLAVIGKAILSKVFRAKSSSDVKAAIQEAEAEIKDLFSDKETNALLTRETTTVTQHKYKDDDLDNV